jgi:hypothetical protein
MKKEELLSKVEDILKLRNKEFTARQLAEIISTDIVLIKKYSSSIVKYKKLLGEDYIFEKVNGFLYFYYVDEHKKDVIVQFKKVLIKNKLRKESTGDIEFNIMDGIEQDYLRKIGIQVIINSFVEQLNNNKYESKELFYPPEKFIDDTGLVEDNIKNNPDYFASVIDLLIKRDSRVARSWISEKREINGSVNKEIGEKLDLMWPAMFCFLASFVFLGYFLKDNSFYFFPVLVYIVGVFYFRIGENSIKEYLKRIFLFFLVYNFIKSIDILNLLSMLPYELEYYPDLRLFIFSFLVTSSILFLAHRIISGLIILKMFFCVVPIKLFDKFNVNKRRKIKSMLAFYKIIKNVTDIETYMLYTFFKFINNFLGVDIKIDKFDKTIIVNKKSVSNPKIFIFFFMSAVLMMSTGLPIIGVKDQFYKSYVIKNDICNNLNSSVNIINLKNGSVLLKAEKNNNEFTLVNCIRKYP